jgi:hypothetical protein
VCLLGGACTKVRLEVGYANSDFARPPLETLLKRRGSPIQVTQASKSSMIVAAVQPGEEARDYRLSRDAYIQPSQDRMTADFRNLAVPLEASRRGKRAFFVP